MDWRNRTVSNTLQITKYTVNDIFISYLEDRLYVNRRYQRKLVWGLREKRLLVDSMLMNIPLPALLLVEYDLPNDNRSNILEIVDGMQRLDTIVSFILGEFGVEYNGEICYFNPDAYAETFQLKTSSDRRLKENTVFLPKEKCIQFYRYPLSVIITGKDDATVDKIFSRINSTGRKISNHDLRQSAAIGEFPDLVRRIASDVRLDNTFDDHIVLCDMKNISIGSKNHGYGVDIESIFWKRHDLINSQNIKESKDEEIIATLLAVILLGSFHKNKDNLDALYFYETELSKRVEEEVAKIGKEALENSFKKVFDTFDMIFESVNSNFSSYLFDRKRTKNKDECFKILFLAIYQLIAEGYVITDYEAVARRIKNAKSVFASFTKVSKINDTELENAIQNLYEILKPSFSKQIIVQDDSMTAEIDKRLSYSRIESQMTEFKIGISNFEYNEVNSKIMHDIAKTLVAMSNTTNTKDEEGFVIIGIADSKESYDSWYSVYGEQALIVSQHYIPGVSCEAAKLYGNTDTYYRMLRKLIEKEEISDKLKEFILANFESFNYHGIELIVFKSKNIGEVSTYKGKKYVRQSNETLLVE